MNFVLKETPLGPHDVSLLAWCLLESQLKGEKKGRDLIQLYFIAGGWGLGQFLIATCL